MNHCLRLNTFRVGSLDLFEIDDKEMNDLEENLASLGVSFGTGEYSNL